MSVRNNALQPGFAGMLHGMCLAVPGLSGLIPGRRLTVPAAWAVLHANQ